MKALILVDIQNDFCPDGQLAVPLGNTVVYPANAIIEQFSNNNDLIIATQDWHPISHGSFAVNHNKDPYTMGTLSGSPQMLWPIHCVQNTYGAQLHSDLNKHKINKIFQKGTDPTVDSYSAFFDNNKKNDTGLNQYLKDHNISELFICGLATDYCVKFTALDAVDLGYTTTVILDACKEVDVPMGNMETSITEMISKRIKFTYFGI